MSPRGTAERLRVGLAVVLAGPVAFLAMSVLSTTTSPSIVLVAAAAATTLAAVVAASGLAIMAAAGGPRPVPLRTADGASVLRAGRVTDTPRHPLRPRAPGLV